MHLTTKILLTLPSVFGLAYMLTFWYPTEFHWLVPDMKSYYIQIGIINTMYIIQLIILIRKLWSFKNLEKKKKTDWIWILILFNSISSLIFIWKRADEFKELNEKEVPNTQYTP